MPGKLVSRMSKRKCFTLSEVDTVKTASQSLHEKKIGAMPVLDKNNNVVGIISERDLSQFIYAERFNTSLSVSQIMSKNLVFCDLNTSVTELMEIMTQKKNKAHTSNGRKKITRHRFNRRRCKSSYK